MNSKLMHRINNTLVKSEENETHLNIDHHTGLFSIETTCRMVATNLRKRYPEVYSERYQEGLAGVYNLPISEITEFPIGGFKNVFRAL